MGKFPISELLKLFKQLENSRVIQPLNTWQKYRGYLSSDMFPPPTQEHLEMSFEGFLRRTKLIHPITKLSVWPFLEHICDNTTDSRIQMKTNYRCTDETVKLDDSIDKFPSVFEVVALPFNDKIESAEEYAWRLMLGITIELDFSTQKLDIHLDERPARSLKNVEIIYYASALDHLLTYIPAQDAEIPGNSLLSFYRAFYND
jgi:hypothetical protein